jgi:hypothetical protein
MKAWLSACPPCPRGAVCAANEPEPLARPDPEKR